MTPERTNYPASLTIDPPAPTENGVRVSMTGSISHDTAHGLLEKLIQIHAESGAGEFALDFDEITMVDSQGIGLLLDLRRRLEERSCAMHIANANPCVRRVLELMHIDKVIDLR